MPTPATDPDQRWLDLLDAYDRRIRALEGQLAGTGAAGPVPGLIPVGGILMWPSGSIPTNYLVCDGSSFSGSAYPELAARLGGTTLPDYRRRMPVGAGTGGWTLGATEGLTEENRSGGYHHHSFSGSGSGSAGTSSAGGHQHGAAGDHQHSSLGGQYFAESGLSLVGAAGTARYTVANGYPQTASAGNHQHPGVGDHTHSVSVSVSISGNTSGGGPSDTPSFRTNHFIIRAI